MGMKRIFLPALVILALAASAAADLPGEEYEALVENGRRLLKLRLYDLAIAELKQAEALAPGQSLAALSGLSRAYEKTDQPGEAITACRSFIESATDSELQAEAYNLLGIWLLREAGEEPGNLEESERAFRETLALSWGKAHRARLNLAEVLSRAGQEEAARGVLAEYPQYEPADRWASLPLGPVSDHVGDQLTELLLAKDPETPVYFLGSVTHPVKIRAPQPVYTEVARQNRTQGLVVVRTIIDKSGEVTKVEVLKGLGYGLEEEAVTAIKEWKFKPATFRGQPVAVYYNLTVNFRLQ